MIVVDASVLADILTRDDERTSKAHAVLASDPKWAAPEHWRIEVVSTIRGLAIGRRISQDMALESLSDLLELRVDSVPVDDLLQRIWQLRDNISAYDAAYVALAESSRTTLVTADGRLARAALPYCAVELVA